jgi:hypothetical protein
VKTSAPANTVEETIKSLSFLISIGLHLGRIIIYFFRALHPAFRKSFAQAILESTQQGASLPDTLPELTDTMPGRQRATRLSK